MSLRLVWKPGLDQIELLDLRPEFAFASITEIDASDDMRRSIFA
jgi:hypothetical protein